MLGVRLTAILFIVFCSLAIAQEQSSGESDKFQQGVDAYANGDYDSAANIWMLEAYQGSTDSQFNLGVMYIEGKGVSQNRNEAQFWFTKAAQAGHTDAQYNLGHLYVELTSDPESVSIGVEWWRKAAMQGLGIAQFNFARALFYGVGVKKDLEGAKFWMEASSEAGESLATGFLKDQASEFSTIGTPQTSAKPTPTEKVVNQEIELEASEDISENEIPIIEDTVNNFSQQQQINNQSYYVQVKLNQEFVHSSFNTRTPIVSSLEKGSLLRVVAQNEDWLQVVTPAGFPGWIKKEQSKLDRNFIEILEDATQIYADPTDEGISNGLGQISKGMKLLLLADEGNWYRILSPESIAGWIKLGSVSQVTSTQNEIAMQWQAQATMRKISSLSLKTDNAKELDIFEHKTQISEADNLDDNAQSEDKNGENRALSTELTVDEFVDQLDDEYAIVPVINNDPREQLQQRFEMGRINRTGAMLRKLPEEGAAPLFNITINTLVNLVDIQNDWARVSIPGGLPIWLPKSAVSMEQSKAIVRQDEVYSSIIPKAGNQLSELGILEKGVGMTILEIKNKWIRVLAPKWISAWVPRKYFDDLGPPDLLNTEWDKQKSILYARFITHKVAAENKNVIAEGEPNSNIQSDKQDLLEVNSAKTKVAEEEFVVGQNQSLKDGEKVTQAPQEKSSSLYAVPTAGFLGIGSTGLKNDNYWLFSNHPTRATLQLLSLKDGDIAIGLFKELGGKGQFFSTVIQGTRWYYILLGSFNDIESANLYRNRLPYWAKGAVAKTFEMLQTKRCDKLNQLDNFESTYLAENCSVRQ